MQVPVGSRADNASEAYVVARCKFQVGAWPEARSSYENLLLSAAPEAERALAANDLGVLAALADNGALARARFHEALSLDSSCAVAHENLMLVESLGDEIRLAGHRPANSERPPNSSRPTRVAILSLLFNWPSTGGGTVHTAETGKFLGRAGYEVCHIYARFPAWGLGQVTEPTGVPSVPLEFDPADWNAVTIQQRFRAAVDAFAPDFVIITDSWNFKPLLAEAVHGYRYFLRLAALECLCPLNNVRLLFEPEGGVRACPRQQLATPEICRQCVAKRQHLSGSLHQAERELAGFVHADYSARLKDSFARAEGVLVVNPLIAEMVAPFARKVHVVPSGFDPERFPWRIGERAPNFGPKRLFFAGLVDEGMKGFHVLQAACQQLWQKRQDFELVVTSQPPDAPETYARYIGWQSQDDLPEQLRQADILIFPTIAEEALGRSAVEAMGAGIPVVASRIGGLQFTVTDGLTGLLFEPGNVSDLMKKIETLLDNPLLRRQMGAAGRQRFEDDYTWDVIIDRHYRRLLGPAVVESYAGAALVDSPVPLTHADRTHVDHGRLISDAADFFDLPPAEVARIWGTFREFCGQRAYPRTPGEQNALSPEETFILGLVASLTAPPVIVDLMPKTGGSTRRIVDLVTFLHLDCRVLAYDRVDQLQHVTREEVDLRLVDIEKHFQQEVLDQHPGGLIFADLQDDELLREVVQETLGHFHLWTLILPRCGRGIGGGRERPVLAEMFGVADPLSPALDRLRTATHRLQIFDTQHGLGVIRRTGLSQGRSSVQYQPLAPLAE